MSNSSIMDSLFQRTLEDLIKGIRLHNPESSTTSLSTFLSKSMDEIRKEIKSTDPPTKSTALLKLTYLHSFYGFDISFASFHIVEVISYPHFALKKIGYLAAAASFNDSTEVLLLATNHFRKDLSSPNDFEVSLALHCLSVIGTHDLCRDLCGDVFTLLSSTRASVKKKAIAVMLKVFTKYPDAVRVCFKRLVDSLERRDDDPQAVSVAVGVFCELTLREPRAYLPLAPEFYRVLIECKNNWVLIKVVKIFAKLAVVEPRLGNKIVGPICEVMERTVAKSLLFECVRTVVTSLSDHESAVKLAALKIRELLAEDDPNLKYLGLRALSDLAATHLWAVLDNKDVVLKSLSDVDPNIKLASLRLLMSMVSEDNVAEIARVLVNYAVKSDPEFCNEVLRSILVTCSRNYYEVVVDFDWYVSLLGEMARVPHCQTGEEIESQIVDIGMRVSDARLALVKVGRDLLTDPALLGNPFLHPILSAAAWVCGEYVQVSKNSFELMEALLQPRTSLLPPSIRAVYIQSVFKVLVFCLQSSLWLKDELAASSLADDMRSLRFGNDDNVDKSEDGVESAANGNGDAVQTQSAMALSKKESCSEDAVLKLLNLTEAALGPLIWSHDVEVQERARNVLGVVQLVKQNVLFGSGRDGDKSGETEVEISDITDIFDDLFSKELGPVAVNAQTRIPVPDDLSLKDNLTDLDMIYSDIQLNPSTSFSLGTSCSRERDNDLLSNGIGREDSESAAVSESLLSQHRKRHGLYYLSSEKDGTGSNDYPPATESIDVDKHGDEKNDILKLTEQSLTLTKKRNHGKARPVVVRLDEGESFIPKKMIESKDDMLSNAVRDVLLGNEEVSTSSKFGEAAKPSSKRKGKETVVVGDSPSSVIADAELGNPGSRRSKHKNHSKERRQRSHGENGKGKEEQTVKEKRKGTHRHNRHKVVEKEGGSNASVQSQQIPDFLL